MCIYAVWVSLHQSKVILGFRRRLCESTAPPSCGGVCPIAPGSLNRPTVAEAPPSCEGICPIAPGNPNCSAVAEVVDNTLVLADPGLGLSLIAVHVETVSSMGGSGDFEDQRLLVVAASGNSPTGLSGQVSLWREKGVAVSRSPFWLR